MLPEPVVTARACGCGIAPEGAPGAAGCSAECMAPELISFGDRATLCFPELAIVDGSGESYTACTPTVLVLRC